MMNLVNHEVITAFKHMNLCIQIMSDYENSMFVSNDEVFLQLVDEAEAAENSFMQTIEAVYESQRKLQEEVNEIDLTQIGWDL